MGATKNILGTIISDADGLQVNVMANPLPIIEAGGGTVNIGAITVTTAATLIKAANTDRYSISVYNNGSATIYVGPDDTVTTSTGMPIPAAAEREIKATTAVYGIIAAATANIRYWEEEQT